YSRARASPGSRVSAASHSASAPRRSPLPYIRSPRSRSAAAATPPVAFSPSIAKRPLPCSGLRDHALEHVERARQRVARLDECRDLLRRDGLSGALAHAARLLHRVLAEVR